MTKKTDLQEISIYTITLGCSKNRVDTEMILGQFLPNLKLATEPSRADIVLINTCAFIQEAIEESLEHILETHELCLQAEHRPILVVTGCLVNRFARELPHELPEVDLWVPTTDQPRLGALALSLLGNISAPPAPQISGSKGRKRVLTTPASYAYLKISEGCNQHCSYCTIPSIRGTLHSFDKRQILQEAEDLLQQGVKELCLIAQDLTAYGSDTGNPQDLLELLEEMCKLKQLVWLRLLYLYPSRLTPVFLNSLRPLTPPLLPYFDLPLQHVHPEILRKMNRPASRSAQETVESIRRVFPDSALRTTLIVGFPGETEEHFASLVKFVQETRFTHLGVFTFSPEPGTRAAQLPGQIPQGIKEERKKILMEIQSRISKQHLTNFKGREMQVLIDRPSPEWPSLYEGRTWFQAPEIDGITYVSGHNVQPGEFRLVEITETMTYDLSGLL